MEIKYKGIKTSNEERVCTICMEEKDKGIRIGKSLICRDCENKIVNVHVESIQYDFYKDKIKNAFINVAI